MTFKEFTEKTEGIKVVFVEIEAGIIHNPHGMDVTGMQRVPIMRDEAMEIFSKNHRQEEEVECYCDEVSGDFIAGGEVKEAVIRSIKQDQKIRAAELAADSTIERTKTIKRTEKLVELLETEAEEDEGKQEYAAVHDSNFARFKAQVNELCKEGWRVQGGMNVKVDAAHKETWFSQALVREIYD